MNRNTVIASDSVCVAWLAALASANGAQAGPMVECILIWTLLSHNCSGAQKTSTNDHHECAPNVNFNGAPHFIIRPHLEDVLLIALLLSVSSPCST